MPSGLVVTAAAVTTQTRWIPVTAQAAGFLRNRHFQPRHDHPRPAWLIPGPGLRIAYPLLWVMPNHGGVTVRPPDGIPLPELVLVSNRVLSLRFKEIVPAIPVE